MKAPTYNLRESPEFQAIAEITRQHGSEELVEDLSELCFLLNAPPNLTKFLYLCLRVLPRILSFTDELEDDGFNIDVLEPAKRWIEWFNSESESFEKKTFYELLKVAPKDRKRNPLHGWGMTRFGLYAALFYRTENDELFDAWARLVLLLWLAQASVLKKHFNREKYESYKGDEEFLRSPYSVYAASRVLRQLSTAGYFKY